MLDWILNYGKKEIVKTHGRYTVRRWKTFVGWEYLDVKSGYWWTEDVIMIKEYCLVDTIEQARVLENTMSIEIMENV